MPYRAPISNAQEATLRQQRALYPNEANNELRVLFQDKKVENSIYNLDTQILTQFD